MAITKTLGGNRLGSGEKMKVQLHDYDKSNFDLSHAWRSTMNVGTLVPFLNEVVLTGDEFKINLNTLVKTIPTTGPLFGKFRIQYDVFFTPFRLYNGLLHNNLFGVGTKMEQVLFPTITMRQIAADADSKIEMNKLKTFFEPKYKFSTSCLASYLGIRNLGVVSGAEFEAGTSGTDSLSGEITLTRSYNAVPILSYYDIYKNYYANQQEGIGYFIHGQKTREAIVNPIKKITIPKAALDYDDAEGTLANYSVQNDYYTWTFASGQAAITGADLSLKTGSYVVIEFENEIDTNKRKDVEYLNSLVTYGSNAAKFNGLATSQFYEPLAPNQVAYIVTTTGGSVIIVDAGEDFENSSYIMAQKPILDKEPIIDKFDLSNIDDMRKQIFKNTGLDAYPLSINEDDAEYSFNVQPFLANANESIGVGTKHTFNEVAQNGLAIKTFQNDIFTNWLSKEWIDEITERTSVAIDVTSFSMDAFNLASKMYDVMNRIIAAGNSYEDWQEAVYGVSDVTRTEIPVYIGGARALIDFAEVTATAAGEDTALGTLAGKGVMQDYSGGNIDFYAKEPGLIMGIVSITPLIDYSEGNKWYLTELESMDDLHKPGLDGIGFENLRLDGATWKAAKFTGDVDKSTGGELTYEDTATLGKVPAWMHYMTSVSEVHGLFAEKGYEGNGWMVLKREYKLNEGQFDVGSNQFIDGASSYINPAAYNYAFADTSLSAQNFWVQIACDINARRKMSSKLIPNL